ncbi:MAG TPA: NADH-quinone oxidoreductase subunit NuoF [bacterium]|nr:NADH-quinone oxidoreductase subunit NuoF [bacterium]
MGRLGSSKSLGKLRDEIISRRDPDRTYVAVCGSGCLAYHSNDVFRAFAREIKKRGIEGKVGLRLTGCLGFCQRGPVVIILPDQICYFGLKDKDVPEVVSETLINKRLVERLLYQDEDSNKRIAKINDIPFYKYQNRLIIGNNTLIDPRNIDDYIAVGGYSALPKALADMTPEGVLEEVKKANLRGRGGGGFPAGRKWQTTRDAPGETKYVIVNGDEGDPGAFMDRSLLEGNPHSVLEGLILGAYAIGAHEGYVYVRQEYPQAIENTELALEQMREYGLLGPNILGSGFAFDVTVHRGAGAFVSGESSALMTAIEGFVGEPRPKYIHTSVKGIWDRPSCLNNVETWANVPLIVNNGADWYQKLGTEGSKGTKIFSLVGKVNNTGLVEVPMGITLRKIIFDIGGGIPEGRKFKAVQTGGPSGGCLPESMLDLPVDFDELSKVGSMMGSGGIIVADDGTCMVDFARYYIEFLASESCGKCIPCREGLRNMLRILNNITAGKGEEGDIETLEELSEVMEAASLCALGQTAANPVLTTIKYFRDEYEAHIRERRCPALACPELISFHIAPDKCKGCGICVKDCPTEAISGKKKAVHVIAQDKCIKCGSCLQVCPKKFNAVVKRSRQDLPATKSS